MKSSLILLAALWIVGCHHQASSPESHAEHVSPYVEEQGRSVKALSDERAEALLAGEGLGYARAAELNDYPGPRHVLDLADSLGLTDVQRRDVDAAFRTMQSRARAAGRALVRTEARLDSLFAAGAATAERVQALTEEAARIEGEVRYAHLAAHVRTREVLRPEQVDAYQRLRGYDRGEGHGRHGGHGG